MAFLDNSGVANLVADLQAKIKASFAAKSHKHSAADVTMGTFKIWQIPTGSTSTTVARGDHGHGYVTSAGAITSDTAVASGDKLIISDSSDSSKLKRSGIAFGTDTTTFLRNDGTWVAPPSLPSVTASDNGKVLQVVNGAWAAASLPSASGVSF